MLQAGDGVTVGGAGTAGSPWVVAVEDPLTCLERKAIYDSLVDLGMVSGVASDLSGFTPGDC